MAEQSVFLESCQPDLGCSMIRCNIGDETTLLFVQIAQLTVLPCSLPVPQVEFQLLDEGTSRFMYMVNSTGQVIINLPGLSLGTLSSFVNHSSNSIGIMVRFVHRLSASILCYTIQVYPCCMLTNVLSFA